MAEPLGAAFASGSKGRSRRGWRCLPSAHPSLFALRGSSPLELLEFSTPVPHQRVPGWGRGVAAPEKGTLGISGSSS